MQASTASAALMSPQTRASGVRAFFLMGCCLLIMGLGLLCVSETVSAATSVAPAPAVPAYLEEVLPDAHLSGQGSFRYFGLKIYDARLWVTGKGYAASAPEAQPFALTLVYARGFEGKKIAQRSIDEIKKLQLGSVAQQQQWLQQMNEVLPDVKEGTELTGVYLPGRGVRFYLDGRYLNQIADPQFAHAFFAIWLDPKTTAPALRETLLQNTGSAS